MAAPSSPVDSTTLQTVGVFADLSAARKAVDVLLTTHGFSAAILSVIGKDAAELAEWASGLCGTSRSVTAADGSVLRVAGPLVGSAGLPEGVDGLMRGVGFQAHDGRIFARLVERGGVLVAVSSDARAADAMAVMHAYGGGNAAIGAWRGRA